MNVGRWLSNQEEKYRTLRPMMQFVKKNNGSKYLIGAEVGVFKGQHALTILKKCKIDKLYLVDINSISEEPFGSKLPIVDFIIQPSTSATDYVPNELDFVYIDADHSYEQVKNDIEAWYPKVRKGGVLGGHDFNYGHLGVCRAVSEFCDKNKFKLYGYDYVESDWWIVK